MANFNFSVDSVFNSVPTVMADITPILPNAFLLLESPISFFLMLSGAQLLLLGP